jgi:hypothetical protein
VGEQRIDGCITATLRVASGTTLGLVRRSQTFFWACSTHTPTLGHGGCNNVTSCEPPNQTTWVMVFSGNLVHASIPL